MPQLKSGRHVALSATRYLDALSFGSAEVKLFAIVALRIHAPSPQALCDHLLIEYFREGEGTPPDAPSFDSGYCVADVLEGRAGWRPDEVDELRRILDEPRFRGWLQGQFDEIERAIHHDPVLGPARPGEDPILDAIDLPMPVRSHVQDFATAADSMRQIRKGLTFALDRSAETVAESEPDPWRALPPLTPELRQVILDLARQPDIRSLSCPFPDHDLWIALIEEQIRRSEATGLSHQEAFCLCAPDTGIHGMQRYDPESGESPFHPPRIGGTVHISWEGVCGGDLFIVPAWRRVRPGTGAQPDSLTKMVAMKCNYALSHRDLGVVDCATRTVVAGCWYLYRSNAPHEDCHPFHRHD